MSEGREKPLSLEAIFNQGPEFYHFINGNQQQPPAQYPLMHGPVHPQQWPNPMYQQLPPDLDYHQRMPRPRPMQPGPRLPPGHDGYHYPQYPPPQYHPQQFQQPRGPGEKRPAPPKKNRPHGPEGFTQPTPAMSGSNGGPKIDLNETEELNSMLNILGIQIGNNESGVPTSPDDENNFISKDLYLVDDNCLKTFTNESDGSYFSNILTFGENITKAAVDKAGKYLAVASVHPGHQRRRSGRAVPGWGRAVPRVLPSGGGETQRALVFFDRQVLDRLLETRQQKLCERDRPDAQGSGRRGVSRCTKKASTACRRRSSSLSSSTSAMTSSRSSTPSRTKSRCSRHRASSPA